MALDLVGERVPAAQRLTPGADGVEFGVRRPAERRRKARRHVTDLDDRLLAPFKGLASLDPALHGTEVPAHAARRVTRTGIRTAIFFRPLAAQRAIDAARPPLIVPLDGRHDESLVHDPGNPIHKMDRFRFLDEVAVGNIVQMARAKTGNGLGRGQSRHVFDGLS